MTSFMAQRAAPLASIDFRSRLLIDRHSSVLSHLPPRRQASLADPSSVDATTWNIFRTLAQLDPASWIPGLLGLGGIGRIPGCEDLAGGVAITLWKRVKPPRQRLLWLKRQVLHGTVTPRVGRRRKGRVVPLSDLRADLKTRAKSGMPLEEPVEIDAIVKCPRSVLFIVIPSEKDSPEESAESDVDRTALLRLVDAGLGYAEARSRSWSEPVSFSLLILARDSSIERVWSKAIRALTQSETRLRRSLPHREMVDRARLAASLGTASWSALETMLEKLRLAARDELESTLLSRLLRHEKSPALPAAR
jgi:hypothetical protein